LSLQWVKAWRDRGAGRRDRTSRKSADVVNIAHLHVRLARQASERDGQLGATTNPHAAQAGATDLYVLRQRGSDQRHRTSVTIGSTAHVLFIGVERLSRTGCSEQQSANKPGRYPCQAHLPILQGGSLLSSGEDRRCECRTTLIPRLPAV
jgi:hypothetical protein